MATTPSIKDVLEAALRVRRGQQKFKELPADTQRLVRKVPERKLRAAALAGRITAPFRASGRSHLGRVRSA